MLSIRFGGSMGGLGMIGSLCSIDIGFLSIKCLLELFDISSGSLGRIDIARSSGRLVILGLFSNSSSGCKMTLDDWRPRDGFRSLLRDILGTKNKELSFELLKLGSIGSL